MAGPTKAAKDVGTIRSRRVHYFIFCHDLKLVDDPLLDRSTQARRNWQMAIYVAHLATGSTIFCRSIRASSIELYLRNVSSFFLRFPRWSPSELFHNDPRYHLAHDTEMAPCIREVLAECKRWDKVPNRCEPFTLAMWDFLDEYADKQGPDSVWAACRDWFGCALYGGFRLTEWAQDDAHPCPTEPMIAPNGSPRAFSLDDIEFLDGHCRPLDILDALARPGPSLNRCRTTYSWQKNGAHGEARLYTSSVSRPRMSFTMLMHRISDRFVRLMGSSRRDLPLSVYRAESGAIRSITAGDINRVMRSVAASVYTLDPRKPSHKKALQKWSSHSLRVGACTILHSMGFTDTQLQFLLRWKSKAFMCYLRNLAILANRQNQAMADLGTMPNML